MKISVKWGAGDYKQTVNVLFMIGATAILLYAFVGELARLFSTKMIDFKHFYYAAAAIVNHTNIYQSWWGGYIYPPFLAFILVPFTVFSLTTSIVLWGVINVLLTVCILWIAVKTIARAFKIEFTSWEAVGACSLAILLSYDQVRWEILQGQCDTLTLLGITLALYWVDRKPVLAGLLLGAAINVKYQALFILPLLIFKGRWRVLTGLVVGTVFCAGIPALIVGWKTNIFYLETALRGIFGMTDPQAGPIGIVAQVPRINWNSNITITSGIYRVFKGHGLTNLDVAIAILFLVTLTSAILLGIFRYYGVTVFGQSKPQSSIFLLECYALHGCVLLFSPQNTMRHLYLFLTIQLLAAVFLMVNKPGVKKWPLFVAVIFAQIGLHISHISNQTTHSFWYFAGGPCWSLLPLVMIITATGLRFSRTEKSFSSHGIGDFQRAAPGVLVGGGAVNIAGQMNSAQ
jgi:hypothetical protein